MPRTPISLTELDAASQGIDALVADATFRLRDGTRLVVRLEASSSDSGRTMFAIQAGLLEGRQRRPRELWRTRARKLSSLLRSFVGEFPQAELPPSAFLLTCRSAQVAPATLRQLVLDALAELSSAGPPAVAKAPRDVLRTSPADWPAILRSGPDGLRRWNRLKAAERKAVELQGVDLGGINLTEANLRGIAAKRASFAGSILVRAEMTDGSFDWTDFSAADLEAARLKNAQATEAVFRGARLVQAVLTRGLFYGASFAGADLTGTDLTDANLLNADLTAALLDGAVLEGASFDLRTQWPAGFAIPAEVVFAGRGTDPRLSGKGNKAVATDVSGLVARLRSIIDPKRMKRTLDMLKSGRNQLFAEVESHSVRGIVRSQKDEDLVYSCVLTEDGTYACCTPDLAICLGLCGEPCKHLLVLLIGLARAGQLDPATADRWVVASRGKKHRWNATTKNHVSDTLLRYKGVQAGEVDWRPTETIPEDFYAM